MFSTTYARNYKKIEECGGIVDGIVCDGATTNRKMWGEFGISGNTENTVNKIMHPFDKDRFLFFFSDAPHLIKCLRNRLLEKPVLHTPDGTIKWMHYERLYGLDMKLPDNLRLK
jgi:hypothetical protein